MEETLALPKAVASRKRRCVQVIINLPASGQRSARAVFAMVDRDNTGKVLAETAEYALELRPEDFADLPDLQAKCDDLVAALHSKRSAVEAAQLADAEAKLAELKAKHPGVVTDPEA
jgi:hypothetical protein